MDGKMRYRNNEVEVLDLQFQLEDRPAGQQPFRNSITPSISLTSLQLCDTAGGIYAQRPQENSRDPFFGPWHPLGFFRSFWNIFLVLIFVAEAVYIPIYISLWFDSDIHEGWLVPNVFCDIIYLLDIIVCFRTSILDSHTGLVYSNNKDIAKNYLTGWFWIDLISFVPFDYIFIAYHNENVRKMRYLRGCRVFRVLKYLKITVILRWVRLSKVTRLLRTWEERSWLTTMEWRIIYLVIVFLFFSHWNACLHVFVPNVQGISGSWLDAAKLLDSSGWEKYGWAMLSCMAEMMTTGYGRVSPQNVGEAWMSIGSQMIGGTFVAVFITLVFSAMLINGLPASNYSNKMQQVDEYMNYIKAPSSIRKTVKMYYEQRYMRKLFNESDVLDQLSPSLREEIILFCRGPTLRKIAGLTGAPDYVIVSIGLLMKTEVFLQGNIIFSEGQVLTNLYILESGLVELVDSRRNFHYVVTEGHCFGEVNQSQLRTYSRYSARAKTTCRLFMISQEDLVKVLGLQPELLEAMSSLPEMEDSGPRNFVVGDTNKDENLD